VVGAILKRFKDSKDVRIMVLPDHPTPISLRTHTDEPVPFAIFGKGIAPDQFESYSEKVSAREQPGLQ